VEGGLGEPALSLPFVALTGQQAVTEEPATIPYNVVLYQVLVVSNQNRLDQVRPVEEVNVNPARSIVEDVAVFSCPACHHRERITTRERHIAN